MKLAIVIVCLAAIATGVVHMRHARRRLGNEVQTLQSRQIVLRRELWEQQIHLGWLVAPAELRRRTQEMDLPLVEKGRLPGETPPPAVGAGPRRRITN